MEPESAEPREGDEFVCILDQTHRLIDGGDGVLRWWRVIPSFFTEQGEVFVACVCGGKDKEGGLHGS